MAAEIMKILNYSQGLVGVVLIIQWGQRLPECVIVFEINDIFHFFQDS